MQQFASATQDCEIPEHRGAGGPHTPSSHTSVALQQGMTSEQVCEVPAQVGGASGAVHVPLVSPGGTTQVSGEQQSPFTVQLVPVGTHDGPPGVVAAQRRTPASSGTHGAELQH